MIWIIILSLLIWGSYGVAIYTLYLFLNFHLPVISAYLVIIAIVVGVAIPTAPGFIGNFQYACILALMVFDVSKGDAFAYSMVLYILDIGLTILVGLAFIHTISDFSFKEMKETLQKRLNK